MITKKRAIITVTLMAILASGYMLLSNKEFLYGMDKKSTEVETVNNIVSVKVQRVNLITKTSGIQFKASLEASDEGVVSSNIEGTVVQIFFENGKQITKGAPLVKLDNQGMRSSLKSAQSLLNVTLAGLTVAEANRDSAQKDFERKKALFDEDCVSLVEVENAESLLKIAKANVETVEADILSARVNVENIKESLSNIIINAPISGIMDEKSVNLGQSVNPGTVLGKVKNISPINAVIEVEQDNLDDIKIGQKAQVKVGQINPKIYEGSIKSIDVSADPSSRAFKCRIELENEDQTLKPGIFAMAEISGSKKAEITVVPIEALVENAGSYYVYINDHGITHKRSVTIGETDKNVVEIKSGLQKGESVICSNVNTLQDGDTISIIAE